MDLTMQSTCGTYGQACIAMTRDTHISKEKILALFFILICSLTTLSGCRTSGQNDKLSNSSDPIINEQELFYGEVKNPDEMFSIVAFYNNYLVYLTFDQNNQAGISRFDMSEGKAVELCKLDDYLMNPANNAILDGKLYLNYMANDSSRKMLEIDINTAAVDIIAAEDNIAGLVYCAATSECVFSLKHTTGGLSIVERYIPETKTSDNFLTFESNRSVCAISVYGEQLYVLLCDETGEYYIVQYSNDGEQMDTWKISFANDILQDSQVGWFQIIDNVFYLMNLSGQSAAFHMDGTLIDELSDWSIATITAGSFSKYAFFCRESNLDIAIYDISKEAPVEFQVCKEETNSIRYIYSDYNNPQRLLISLRNEVTGNETISVISSL